MNFGLVINLISRTKVPGCHPGTFRCPAAVAPHRKVLSWLSFDPCESHPADRQGLPHLNQNQKNKHHENDCHLLSRRLGASGQENLPGLRVAEAIAKSVFFRSTISVVFPRLFTNLLRPFPRHPCAFVCLTAVSQASNLARRAAGFMAGLKRASACHCEAISAVFFQNPTASPAR